MNDTLDPFTLSKRSIFDRDAAMSVLSETGIPIAQRRTADYLEEQLNEIALAYYWDLFNPPDFGPIDTIFTFSGLADYSVTPSRLRYRLVRIERAAKRVLAGRSKRPLTEKVVELLERLGYDRHIRPLRYSGTEEPGHGGSERSAVQICMIKAIQATERPPKGYRPKLKERPWSSQRFDETIKALGTFVQSPDVSSDAVCAAARSIHSWARWFSPQITLLMASGQARHHGQLALDNTLIKLGALYQDVFGKRPSLSRRIMKGGGSIPNPWEKFLHAVLGQILSPSPPPEPLALQARWRRLLYTVRKNRF